MFQKHTHWRIYLPFLVLILPALACAIIPGAAPAEATPTHTPTLPATLEQSPTASPTATYPPVLEVSATSTPPESPCLGLSGEIEVKILVGPSAAVGLTPHAVGSVPFSVTTSQPPYLVQGAGTIDYADTLVENWGTYQVTLDAQFTVDGVCVTAASQTELQLDLEMVGTQTVEVTSQGFHNTYPWSGTHHFDLIFPLVEGATVQAEGYTFVLHLPSQ